MKPKARDLNLVYAISFLDLFAIGLAFPLLGNHLRDLGASNFTVGLINSLYSGLQVLSGPVVGGWSDVKDRTTVLIITLSVCCIGYVFLGLTSSLLIIASIRFLLGVVKHTQSLCKALITDILPSNERAGAFSQSAAYSQLGFIFGPILGGHMSELTNGFTYVCFIAGLLFIINIGLAWMINSTKQQTIHPQQEHNLLKQFRAEIRKSVTDLSQIKWVDLWDTFLLRFIFGVSMTMYFSQQAVYLREHYQLSQRHIGYTISFFGTTGTVSAFVLQYITSYFYKNDFSCYKRLLHFFLLMTLSAICLYLAPSIQLFLCMLVPFSLSCTVLRIVSMELMLKQVSKDHTGSLSGASNSIMSIARFVTPVTTGVVTDLAGGHTAMLFTAIPPLVGAVLAYKLKLKSDEVIKTQ